MTSCKQSPARPASLGRWPGGRLFTTLRASVLCSALQTFRALRSMFATLHAGIGVKQTHSYARSLEKWFSSRNLKFDRANYFCAGISFYNLSAIRTTGVFDKVLEFGKRFENFNCADQSMLYGAIGDKVKLLPDRWQTFPRNGIPDSSSKNVVLHYAGEVPWKVTSCTHLITDTQLLWFDACSLVFNESLWRSLRRFYSSFTIIKARLLFVSLFKIWPMSILGKIILTCAGIKNFKETLRSRKQYLKNLHVTLGLGLLG